MDEAASGVPSRRAERLRRRLLGAFLVVLMAVCGLLILGAVTSATGFTGFLIGTTLALLPLPLLLAAYRWLDRYEPEPGGLLAYAFFWGATVAALASAVLNTAGTVAIARAQGGQGDLPFTAVAVAPWVEEAAKGAAILAIVLFRRVEFDGLVDGIVFAGLVGLGFAFTENVLYFGRAFLMGSEELGLSGGFFAVGLTFVLRGVLAPFAHPLFTTMTGIGLAVAVGTRRPDVRVLAPVVGYLAAVALHSAWNYASLSGISGFIAGYALIFLPAFALAIGIAAWSRRREGAIVAASLPSYAEAGWLAPQDVDMLASIPRRRQAVQWVAASYGEANAAAMRDFQRVATELAFLRHRAERGHPPRDFAARERALLAELARSRAAVPRSSAVGR